ncbi:MAG: hypothetical protein ACOC53_07385 [Candidatus Saliniplasma sp.]
MVRKRPIGVIILGVGLVLYALLAFSIAQGYLAGDDLPWTFLGYKPLLLGLGHYVLGLIYIIIAVTRLIAAAGVLTLKRKSWSTAFILITIGMVADILLGLGVPLLLGIIALIYLIIVKDKFRYS